MWSASGLPAVPSSSVLRARSPNSRRLALITPKPGLFSEPSARMFGGAIGELLDTTRTMVSDGSTTLSLWIASRIFPTASAVLRSWMNCCADAPSEPSGKNAGTFGVTSGCIGMSSRAGLRTSCTPLTEPLGAITSVFWPRFLNCSTFRFANLFIHLGYHRRLPAPSALCGTLAAEMQHGSITAAAARRLPAYAKKRAVPPMHAGQVSGGQFAALDAMCAPAMGSWLQTSDAQGYLVNNQIVSRDAYTAFAAAHPECSDWARTYQQMFDQRNAQTGTAGHAQTQAQQMIAWLQSSGNGSCASWQALPPSSKIVTVQNWASAASPSAAPMATSDAMAVSAAADTLCASGSTGGGGAGTGGGGRSLAQPSATAQSGGGATVAVVAIGLLAAGIWLFRSGKL